MRFVYLTLGCLIACKDKPVAPPSSGSAPPPQSVAAAHPSPQQDGITLVSPGSAPLHVLRYRLTKGAKASSELVYDVTIKSDGEGGPSPSLVVDLETTVEDVLADGSAMLRIAVTHATARGQPGTPAATELARKQAVAMQGVVLGETLAPDGKPSNVHVEAGPTVGDSARAQLDGLLESLAHVSTQLPAEPVGVGATWQARRTLPPGGIRAVSETVYTVTAVTGDSFAFTSTGQMSGGSQVIERDGVKVEVTNTRGHAEAKGSVDLVRYALDVAASSVFTATMNALVPKDTPGAGASTIEISTATRMMPIAAPVSPAEPDQGAHKAP